MAGLIEKFLENSQRYIRRKHQNSRETERRRIRRILDFLKFCETQGRKKIKDIQQKDWTNFCRFKRQQGAGDETMRQYALVVREFARRAHIELRVNPNNFRKRKR